MEREFLKGLGLADDVINSIMSENGKDINREKAKFADYDELKTQLANANSTIEKFADYDATKADVEKYKAEAEKARKDAEEKIALLELQGRVKDYTSSKKFVNELTRDAINSQLETALNAVENKGRSIDELFNSLIDGKENILVNDSTPTAPTIPTMTDGNGDKENGVFAAFKALNPNIKL